MKFSSSTYPSPPPGLSNSGEGGICQAGTYCIGGSAGETSCDFGTYNPNKQQSQCQVREIRDVLLCYHLIFVDLFLILDTVFVSERLKIMIDDSVLLLDFFY